MKKLILIILIIVPRFAFPQGSRIAIYSMTKNTYPSAAVASYDLDAQALFTNAGITNENEKTKYNDFVLREKAAGRYAKCAFFYPFLGTTAATQKYNAIDPRDLDVAFRLSFGGGAVTHSNMGITGSTSFGNTFFNTSTNYPSGFITMGVYSRTDNNTTTVDMGSYNATGTKYQQMFLRFGGTFYGNINMANISASTASASSIGWRAAGRTTATNVFFQIDAAQFNATVGAVSIPTVPIYLMARNDDNVAALHSARQLGCAGLWKDLTLLESAGLQPSVQTLMNDLLR